MLVLHEMLNLAFIQPGIYQQFPKGNFTTTMDYDNNFHRVKVVKEIEVKLNKVSQMLGMVQ